MKRHGQITYELTEEEYTKIKNKLNYIKWFFQGEEYYEEDAKNAINELNEMFDNE